MLVRVNTAKVIEKRATRTIHKGDYVFYNLDAKKIDKLINIEGDLELLKSRIAISNGSEIQANSDLLKRRVWSSDSIEIQEPKTHEVYSLTHMEDVSSYIRVRNGKREFVRSYKRKRTDYYN